MKPLILASSLQIVFYCIMLNNSSVNYFENARKEEQSDRMSFDRFPQPSLVSYHLFTKTVE